MKILILGGTVFLGRALVESAINHGHEVTLFNRGKSNPGLFPGVEEIHGDRKESLEALAGRRWDAVIDTCGYFPKDVRKSAEFLADLVDHYTFISSISAYASFSIPWQDENSPLARMEDENAQEITGETYGPLKVLCEEAAEAAMPGRVLVIRPGLIVGPHDPSDRFTYWPYRVWQGGEVLAPGSPNRGNQFIDVRDLADWNISMLERGSTGIYNATGPEMPVSMDELLETCRSVSGSDARFIWASEGFLQKNNIGEWIEMPLWVSETNPDNQGLNTIDISKAVGEGLAFRSLQETSRDTLDWAKTRPEDHKWRTGITPERERELIEKLRDKTKQ
jgi:2'-hydroxyisoflavone reductase